MPSKKSGLHKGQAKKKRSSALIERDIDIYKRSLRGESVRAIAEVYGIKSSNTVQVAIGRGREHAKVRGIDVEEKRIHINQLFEETLGLVMKQVRHQSEHGLVTEMIDAEGNTMLKRVRGIDPRLAAELGRAVARWSDFLGLSTDSATDAGAHQQTTVILSAPTAGADFESRYSSPSLPAAADQQTVDTVAVPVKETVVSSGGPGWGEKQIVN